jgi:pimeloyl-ACP methyl ester carboxylesterase
LWSHLFRDYEKKTYYVGEWKPEYDKWVAMLDSMYQGKDFDLFAWDQAHTTGMILSQPVVYELGDINVPSLLLIGAKDNTAIGKAWPPPEVVAHIGHYSELGPDAAKAIKGSILVMFPTLGHAPQIQDPRAFHEALLKNLETLRRPPNP